MWWMWIVGPILVLIIYVLTGGRDKRSEAEVERWRRAMGPKDVVRKPPRDYRDTGKKVAAPGPGAKTAASLPGPLFRLVQAAGGGDRVMWIELAPKSAYLAAMAANATSGSDHQTVVALLQEPGPSFTVRPLTVVDRPRVGEGGIEFKKDQDFMAMFLVEAATKSSLPPSAEQAKKVRGWLSRPLRDALCDLPDAWLRVEGKAMALTLYGPADADKLTDLVTVADVFFAEHGVDGGQSLLGDDDEDEPEEEEEEADEPPSPPPAAKKSKAGKPGEKAAPTKS